ncbi:MAG TPA: T9SS type A sorting domain-containing protein [Bacteroidales bacterium]|nr:T9SS type A sorting domain-containing protein [Bacteroidales bacterium]
MKTLTTLSRCIVAVFFFILISQAASAQCVPMGPEECPDPENNGQVCPDTMPVGYLNQAYSEEATILAPQEYGTGIVLHHITLADLGNLPPGITWQSNAVGNEFMAGNYYCMILEGTPTVADTFYLKIVIDVYLNIAGMPVFFAQVTDSTSLAMIIREEFGIDEAENKINLEGNFPNPFSDLTNIRFEAIEYGQASFEVYSLLGEKLHEEEIIIRPGENNIVYDGDLLPAGPYFYVIRKGNTLASKIFIRKN